MISLEKLPDRVNVPFNYFLEKSSFFICSKKLNSRMSDQSESENDENLEVMNQWLDFFADAGIPPSDAAQESASNT